MMRRISAVALFSAQCFSTLTLHAEPAPKSAAAPKASAAPKADAAPKTDPAKAEAAQRFDRGLTLFNEGDNAGALAEFKQTYALMPNPIVLFNIGLVYAAMARPVDAVDALSAVVGSSTLSPEQHDRAQKTLEDQQARIGRLSITTVPDGARIDLDGVEVAKTPLSAPLRVAEGTHVIGAVAEGYAHVHKEVVIAGNADASLSFELVLGQAKRPANLTVHSRTPGADVLVDGLPGGKTPLATSVSLPAGHHSVELRRPGYQTSKQDVELGEGATGDVTLDLSVDSHALSAEGADFSIELREPNANVTVDDERFGLYTQPLRLPKGEHHVRLEVAGFLPFEQDVTLESGKPNVLTPFLSPTPETRQAHDSNVRLHRVLGFVGVGLGAALAGSGVALAVVGGSHKTSAQKDLDTANAAIDAGKANKGGAPCNPHIENYDAVLCGAPADDAQTRIDHAKTEQLVGFIGIGAGAAVLATGVVLLFTGESSHRFDPPSKNAGAQSPSWAFAPGPGQLGLGLLGAF
jgi:hypothetical protein